MSDDISFEAIAVSGDYLLKDGEHFYYCSNEHDLEVDEILSTSLWDLDDDSVIWLIDKMSKFCFRNYFQQMILLIR
jgi:hypothetical protein